MRREAGEAARARDRQAAAASQNEAEESGATEEEATGARTTRVGRPRGGIKVAARIGDRLRREIGRVSQEVRYEDSRGDQCLDLHREASPIITLFLPHSAE